MSDDCTYVDDTFAAGVMAQVAQYDNSSASSAPLFVFWALHVVHAPLQVPQKYYDQFAFIDDWRRQRYHAMIGYLDTRVGELVDALREKDMYDNSVIFFR
jgi:arylsulfatase I/J